MENVKLLSCAIMIAFLLGNCITPVESEFDYREDLIFIDGFVLTEPGFSYVSVKESFSISNTVAFSSLDDASVTFESMSDSRVVNLRSIGDGFYYPPEDFHGKEGEAWKLFVELADGRSYTSSSETVPKGVGIDKMEAEFMDELVFDEGYKKFVPGHRVSISFTDPGNEQNYYLWKYKSYEPKIICTTCSGGVLRDNTCIAQPIPRWQPQYYNYMCLQDCWRVRYGDKIPTFSDLFSDGERQEKFPVADVYFFRKQDVLVEMQQLSVGENTHKYFKTINDLITESGGLNAPTPTALLGNLVNTTDSDNVVLGQFSCASLSIKRMYIERDQLPFIPLEPLPDIHVESCIGCPTFTDCDETRASTQIKPVGWPN